MSINPPSLIPFPFSTDDSHQRLSREITHVKTNFSNHLIYTSTVFILSEIYSDDICTLTLFREHQDSYLYYKNTHSLTGTPDEPLFSLFAYIDFVPDQKGRFTIVENVKKHKKSKKNNLNGRSCVSTECFDCKQLGFFDID